MTPTVKAAYQEYKLGNFYGALLLYSAAASRLGEKAFFYNINKCKSALSSLRPLIVPEWNPYFSNSEFVSNRKEDRPHIAGMATMPSRVETLRLVIDDILPQIDKLHIFLNNFASVPSFLDHEKIAVHLSQEHGDQRDNGKFFGLRFTDDDSYFFTLDDDIRYPKGYFNLLASKVKAYDNRAAVGVHGVLYPKFPRSFFERITFNFERSLSVDLPVSILGTGTACFHTGRIKPDFSRFDVTGMADLVFSNILKQLHAPSICIARPRNWLVEYTREEKTDTIYFATKTEPVAHNHYLLENAPWGCESILESVKDNKLTVQPLAAEFLGHLASIEQKASLSYLKAPASTAATLLYTSGLTAFSDSYVLELALKLFESRARHLEERPAATRPQMVALIRDYFEDVATAHAGEGRTTTLSCDLERWHEEVISEYLEDSRNSDIAMLLYAARMLVDPAPSADLVARFVQTLVNVGRIDIAQSALTPHELKSLDDDDLLNVLKSSVIADSALRHSLHESLQERNLQSHGANLVRTLYAMREGASSADSLILGIIRARYSSRNKLKHLQEIKAFAGETGFVPEARLYLKILASSDTDTSIKLRLVEILIQQEAITTQSVASACLDILEHGVPAEERPIWQAEILRQVQGGCALTLRALNGLFSASGMSVVRQREAAPRSFLASLQADKVLPGSQGDSGLCSVVIAAYNAESTLQYAYDSICAQTYRDIEIIVVDDASSVPVESYLRTHPSVRTRIVRNERNRGPYGCRNVALDVAKGAYFVIHDADDWAHPEKIELQIQSMHAQAYVCSYTRHIRVTSDARLRFENHGRFIGHGPMTSLFKTEVFENIGVFDEVATRGDMEFKDRIRAFYGPEKIHEDPRVTLLSLDWNSNSKQKTSNLNKLYKLSNYKNRYRQRHQLVVFAQRSVCPPGLHAGTGNLARLASVLAE